MAKMIIIEDCMECPKIAKCNSWKKLTPKQKFTLKTGVGIGKFILKDCPLNDVCDSQKAETSDKSSINYEPLLAVVIDDNIKSWWNSLTTLQKLDAENKTFGTGDEYEDNTLTDNDIVKMYNNR